MRRASRLLLGMIVFYLAVAVCAIILLRGDLSVIPQKSDAPGAQPAVLSDTVIVDPEPEEVPAIVPAEEEVPAIVEPEPEPEPAPEPVPDGPRWPRYFSFVVRTETMPLHVRKAPSLQGEIVSRLRSGTRGYVLQPGDDWSLIVVPDVEVTGYCSNQFLVLRELAREEYPEAYLERLTAPDPPLTEVFEGRIREVSDAFAAQAGAQGISAGGGAVAAPTEGAAVGEAVAAPAEGTAADGSAPAEGAAVDSLAPAGGAPAGAPVGGGT